MREGINVGCSVGCMVGAPVGTGLGGREYSTTTVVEVVVELPSVVSTSTF